MSEQNFENISLFSGKMKMADLILHDYRLLLVFERFKIDLGFGDKSVDTVCGENNIDNRFFLIIANIFHNKNYFPDQVIKQFNPVWLLNYLKNSHDYYLNEMIPYIERLVDKTTFKSEKKEAGLLIQFFKGYKTELSDHIRFEDQTVFPYILELQKTITNKLKPASPFSFSINEFKEHHNNIEEKIMDMKNLLIKYFSPSDNAFLTNKLLSELFELHADLDNHTRIEEKVLIPLVESMEKSLSK